MVNNNGCGDACSGSELMDFLQKSSEQGAIAWKLQRALGHEQVKPADEHCMGLATNIKAESESGGGRALGPATLFLD